MQTPQQRYPRLFRIVDNEIAGADESIPDVMEGIIELVYVTLRNQENRPITVSQMKNVIMGAVSVPLFIDNAMEADVSLVDRFISNDLAIRTMQAIATDSPKEFHFDPEYNDLSFIEEEAEKERIE